MELTKIIAALDKWSKHETEDGYKLIVSEPLVALTVFAITFVWYSIFVTGTIGQICDYLDIHCLTIKPKFEPVSKETIELEETKTGKTT